MYIKVYAIKFYQKKNVFVLWCLITFVHTHTHIEFIYHDEYYFCSIKQTFTRTHTPTLKTMIFVFPASLLLLHQQQQQQQKTKKKQNKTLSIK